MNPRVPELLSPAGDWECAKAAVENGADAIYFGLARFNARMRAQNFTEADLPSLMEFLHLRGVKGYVTFNTLVFADELSAAEEHLRSIIAAGVDAAIVQDVGICRLIRQLSPDFPIHASTQMTITSAAGVKFAKELGCSLVVLARECSIKEIDRIQIDLAATENAHPRGFDSPLPLEVFVHGALCVAYSGQCLTSEALGGRSANRGECAQACRMPYELFCDAKQVPLGDRRYLLSPQDLAGLEVLPDLILAGVSSLKIEGRLKSPEYVANITRVYRNTLDGISAELSKQSTAAPELKTAIEALTLDATAKSRYDLEMAFSRGLHTGWFRGIDNQRLVHARFGKKRGVYLGEVSRVENQGVVLKLQAPLKAGDGVVFDAGRPDEKEQGGRIHHLDHRRKECLITFGHTAIDFHRIHIGDKVWKTSDPELDRRLRQTFAGERIGFTHPVDAELHGAAGSPMTIVFRDECGNEVQVSSRMAMSSAEKQPLTAALLRQHVGRLGGTPFKLGKLQSRLEGQVILPFSEINWMRREAVNRLKALRAQPKRWTQSGNPRPSESEVAKQDNKNQEFTATSAINPKQRPPSEAESPELIVLVRSLAQLQTAMECGVRTLYCEFEDPKKYREAVSRFREFQTQKAAFGTPCGLKGEESPIVDRQSQIFVAPPRIFKMGEEWILKQVLSSEADGYLIRNYDHLRFFTHVRRIGDFSLNIANRLSAEYFIHESGLDRVTASYDLNFSQLEALLLSAPPEWFEITIHQHMPMFHMEHCVFCAFLSSGTDYSNCGRPCDKHEVKLRDRVGASHPLKADAGCRNTLFNAVAQTGAEYVSRMLRLGVRHFRIEFLNESSEQIVRTIASYRQLLRGQIQGAELWRELKLFNQLGVTRGQM